jgi:hypothetical protein
MRSKNIVNRPIVSREGSACPAVEFGREWRFYTSPEDVVGRASKTSRQRRQAKTRISGAVRETPEGIEIMFFPRSA